MLLAPFTPDPRQIFFDTIAGSWDAKHDLPAQARRLAATLRRFGIRRSETVLDIGCGTGSLVQALLAALGPDGRTVALDISPAMLAQARRKISDPRVAWHEAPADQIPMPGASADRIICLASWPHFENPENVLREFRRVLRDGGRAHILHLNSREAVNRIHANAHPSVHSDILAPAAELAPLFERNGFTVLETSDDTDGYLLTAEKRKSGSPIAAPQAENAGAKTAGI